MTEPVRYVCVWCEPHHLISGPVDGPGLVSHGMCLAAVERVRQEAEQREKQEARSA